MGPGGQNADEHDDQDDDQDDSHNIFLLSSFLKKKIISSLFSFSGDNFNDIL